MVVAEVVQRTLPTDHLSWDMRGEFIYPIQLLRWTPLLSVKLCNL